MKTPNFPSTSSHRGLKICLTATLLILIVVVAVLATLTFTLFKPKEPEIIAQPVGLASVMSSIFAMNNVTLNMTITINNKRNYGSFKFKNGTAFVTYHNDVVAEVPIGQNLVPARGNISFNATMDLMVGKILSNPGFFEDFVAGSLNLTAKAGFRGRMNLFNVVKMRARVFTTCDIAFFCGL